MYRKSLLGLKSNKMSILQICDVGLETSVDDCKKDELKKFQYITRMKNSKSRQSDI